MAAASDRRPLRFVSVRERDFSIHTARRIVSGDVRLSVANEGPDAHELIVVRSIVRRLPLRRDGMTVDEEALKPEILGTLEPGEPRTRRTLELHLAPGRYELLCNMSGHYLGGMHRELVVR